WAISVPRRRQSAAPTLAARGIGFGIPSYLVDGNDILAVYAVMRQAIERARTGEGPTLVETLTYRIGAHTTADDPTRYRDAAEVEAWQARDPIARFRRFLLHRDLLTEQQDSQLLAEIEEEINRAADEAEAQPPPTPDSFFDWTYAEPSQRLQAQRADLLHYTQRPGGKE
ncbi:MAG: pyruvate dehydrogenase (acetyl-transferring) E1 component subunit alpha, partial [Ktedonobacteraceae bacterium]|nr:pyruvate dehydrogenase (acetyl-transferring) E1 component subunit alpha [Ktedonobacteraceae bacterium]